jgi:hypothetical protein
MNLNNVESIDGFLQPQYRGHETKFWIFLQSFHDTNENWTKHGLSEQGILAVKQIREKIKTIKFPETNIIDEWLEKNSNPEISKQVEKEAEELFKQNQNESK